MPIFISPSTTIGFCCDELIAMATTCGGMISSNVQLPLKSRLIEPRFEIVIVPCSISCFVSLSDVGIE